MGGSSGRHREERPDGRCIIAGIAIAIFCSVIRGIIVALDGLVAFGGFLRGRWF
jgi:hypothetical protein